jgi:HK97 family phage major capsid protein
VLEQEAMPSIAAGTYPLLFGDPGAYEIVDRIGMSVRRYDVSPGQNIVHYEAKFRVGGQVTRPWAMAAQLVSA